MMVTGVEARVRPLLSQKAQDLRRHKSPVRQIMDFASPAYFRKLGLTPSDVISFAGGWVNHAAPEPLREAYARIARDGALFHESGGYAPTVGRDDCRRAIAAYEGHLFGLRGLGPEQIAIGANSTQLTYTLLTALLDPGDRIALLDPSYCNFPVQILSGQDAEIIRFPVVDEESFEYLANRRIAEFGRFILENKPRVVLLVAPDNPTSQILSDAFVEAALAAVQEIGGVLVIDFAYKELVFADGYPRYFSWLPSDQFISIHSNSKWCRGLGRRLGWLEAPESVVAAIEALQGASTLCPDTLHQMALVDYLGQSIPDGSLRRYVAETSALYAAAAAATVEAIAEHVGLPCFCPQGGLYTCMRVGTDGAAFVENALARTGVLLVPGWGFGRSLRNGVRLSYGPLVNDLEQIREGMRKLGRFLRG